MSATLERRFEDRVRETGKQAFGMGKAVFEGVKKKSRREEEERGEDWRMIAKIKANQIMRRVVSYVRPQMRFQV